MVNSINCETSCGHLYSADAKLNVLVGIQSEKLNEL